MSDEPSWTSVPTASGDEVPLLCADRADAAANVLVLPALGVEARFYERFASALAARGLAAAVMELRGHGRSALRAGRGVDWGFRETLEEDVPAALGAAAARASGRRRTFLCGHSLGGHLGVVYAALHPEELDGLVLIATASPYYGHFAGAMRTQIRVLTALLPALTGLLGYFPGSRLGFGGRESRGTMADWSSLARRDRYRVAGVGLDLETAIGRFARPVLDVRYADDALAPERAVEGICAKLASASITRACLSAEPVGARADHYAWAKRPDATADAILAWTRASRPVPR